MARNEKGEDWTKYLKEIKRLTPMVENKLNGGSNIPIINSRQGARAAGYKNLEDAKAGIEELARRNQAIEEHKVYLINKWFDDQLGKRLPAWLVALARSWGMWVLGGLGFRWGYWDHSHREGDMPKAMPATRVWLKWARWVLVEERLVWDSREPPKRRIVSLP
jgi:hypothetical protein